MTPANIAGMASLNGLEIVALTDHNSSKNCPAFFAQAKRVGIIPVAGMELTTAEDIHLVCLLRTLPEAEAFGRAVDAHRIRIRNRPQFFGHQYQMDAEDNIVWEDPDLLPNATDLPLEDAYALACELGAVCYPAHVDREANGILAILGDLPDRPVFRHAEFREPEHRAEYCRRYPRLQGLRPLFGSDAHRPDAICDAQFSIEIAGTGDVASAVMEALKSNG